MQLKDIKNNKYFNLALYILVFFLFIYLLFFVYESIKLTSMNTQSGFIYTIKINSTIGEIDKILERSEVNLGVLADSIANTYDINQQQDEKYNFDYIQKLNGLVKAVLANSPGVNGVWFQLNASLPFAVNAYNWYEFKDNQFINLKEQFETDSLREREITPEDDPYYFDAVANEKTTWSDVYIDPDTKTSMITVSMPLYSDRKLIGVVGIDISTDNLKEALENMQVTLYNSELFLLDKNNNIIVYKLLYSDILRKNYPFFKLLKKNEPSNRLLEYMENGSVKTAIMLVLSNQDKLIITFNDTNLFPGLDKLFKTAYFIAITLFILILMIIIKYLDMIIDSLKNLNLTKKFKPICDVEEETKESIEDEKAE